MFRALSIEARGCALVHSVSVSHGTTAAAPTGRRCVCVCYMNCAPNTSAYIALAESLVQNGCVPVAAHAPPRRMQNQPSSDT